MLEGQPVIRAERYSKRSERFSAKEGYTGNIYGGAGVGLETQINLDLSDVGQAQRQRFNTQSKSAISRPLLIEDTTGVILGQEQTKACDKNKATQRPSTSLNGAYLGRDVNRLGPANRLAAFSGQKSASPGLISKLRVGIQDQYYLGSGYYSDTKNFKDKKPVRRASSVPINQKETKYPAPKVKNRVNPNLKESFCSGKIFKWTDFTSQKLRKKQDKSNLSVHDLDQEVVDDGNKPPTLKVYTRNCSRKNRGGKKITNDSYPLQEHVHALLGVNEESEGERGVKGLSSSDDDNSSEDFNFTSDFDVEVEKEIQAEAAYEGIRCLLGDGS